VLRALKKRIRDEFDMTVGRGKHHWSAPRWKKQVHRFLIYLEYPSIDDEANLGMLLL
jgi:hypothetical protein